MGVDARKLGTRSTYTSEVLEVRTNGRFAQSGKFYENTGRFQARRRYITTYCFLFVKLGCVTMRKISSR